MALTLEEILERRNKILDEFLQSLGTSLKEIRIKGLKEFITSTEGWGHQNLAEYIEKIIDDLIIKNKDNLDIQAFEYYITDAQNLIEDIGIEELDYEKPKYGLSAAGPKQDLADLKYDLQYGMFPDDVRTMDIEAKLDSYKNSNNKTNWLADEIYNLSGAIANDEANTSMRHVMPESWEFRQLMSNGPKLIEHFEEGIASGKYTLEDVDNIFKNIEVSSYMKPADGTVLGQYKPINNFADYKDVFYNYFLPDFYKKVDEYINGTGDSFRVFNNRESIMLDNYNVYVGFGNPKTPYNQVWEGFGEAILTPEFQRRAADEMIAYNTTDATLPLSPEDLGKHNKLIKELREEYADLMTDSLIDIQSGYGDDVVVKQDVSKLRNAGVSEESIVIQNIDNIAQGKPIVKDTPTNVVDDINNKAINQAGEVIDVADDTTTDLSKVVTKSGYKRYEDLAKKAPDFVANIFNNSKKLVSKAFSAAGVLDPGDVAITQGLTKVLPRLGLASISLPALAAYTAYELTILAIDAVNAFDKARQNQGIELLDYDNDNQDIDWKQIGKDTWQEMGEISDTWSLSYKISEPIIDSVFKQAASITQEK